MMNIEVVEDILRFPKSLRSPSKDTNSESYGHCKLGNIGIMYEDQIEEAWYFGLLGLSFGIQMCS